MARYDLVLPQMGESVSEATIVNWLKQPGDQVDIDDSIVEIATDKVDSEVPSPVAGRITEIRFAKDEVAKVGDVIAVLEVEGEEEGNQGFYEQVDFVDQEESQFPVQHEDAPVEASDIPGLAELGDKPQQESHDINQGERFYSPLVRNIAAEEGISLAELEQIKGSGLEGRLTKQDVMDYLSRRGKTVEAPDKKETGEVQVPNQEADKKSESATKIAFPSGQDEIIEMDRMRRLIAEHMVHSVQTAPHVCSFVEADVTNIVNWRNRVKDDFQKKENEKLTFTPIFIEATVKALQDFPMVNISVNGTQIIKKHDIHIGMATALPNGNLIVPVIKNAKHLSLTGITKAVNDLAERARNNKLKPDDTQGGTFTITNIGSFGNMMGTPIINQPQVAILAVGTITKKPAVIETEYGDVIAIRHLLYLSLSYDHRVVDGALGGMFLRRIADYLEKWDVNRGF